MGKYEDTRIIEYVCGGMKNFKSLILWIWQKILLAAL